MLSQYKRQKVSEITSTSSKIKEIINTLTDNGQVKTSFVALENENYSLKSELEQTPNNQPSQYTAFDLIINDLIQKQIPPEQLLKLLKIIGLDIKKKFKDLLDENSKLLSTDFDKYLEDEFYFNIDDLKTDSKRPNP